MVKDAFAITNFDGPFRFLSNFYPSLVSLGNERYPTVEHAYQAAKTLDRDGRRYIRFAPTPLEAKRRGRKLVLRDHWDDIKLAVMKDLLEKKFSVGPLRTKLLETLDADLVEGNTWHDYYWGVCNRKGENHLGKLLMEVREGLRREIS